MTKEIKTTDITVTEKNIGELKGLLAVAKANGNNVAIIKVPIYMMAIDESYQTVDRTARKLNYLVNRWDDRKIGVLTVVPHEEEGLVYIVDGYGRWKASQLVDKAKYTHLDCAVLLNAPTDPRERQKFEAELFANQNRDVAKLKPVDKHGAMQVLEDPAALALDELQEKYGFTIGKRRYKGNNATGMTINNIYQVVYDTIRIHGKGVADWYFNICQESGLAIKTYGYTRYTFNAVKDAYIAHPDKRDEIARILVDYFEPTTPQDFKAEAVTRYPKLDSVTACMVYARHIIAERMGLEYIKEITDSKVVNVTVL